ncbi:hypothetical protein HF521_020140 [Silurus meridionalis]|uniref:Uncharacterized protein n=1 Tax=Silurus meridionalis TaxID=175797 RepID=A0A8T0BN83_SILME|nr:hypothetical protein HF521_020140 [Silurus meridionalis]
MLFKRGEDIWKTRTQQGKNLLRLSQVPQNLNHNRKYLKMQRKLQRENFFFFFFCLSSSSVWMGIVSAQQFFRSLQMFNQVQVWGLAGPLEDIHRATPLLSWLCAQGRCSVGRKTVVPEVESTGFHQGYLGTLLKSSFSILTSLPV